MNESVERMYRWYLLGCWLQDRKPLSHEEFAEQHLLQALTGDLLASDVFNRTSAELVRGCQMPSLPLIRTQCCRILRGSEGGYRLPELLLNLRESPLQVGESHSLPIRFALKLFLLKFDRACQKLLRLHPFARFRP